MTSIRRRTAMLVALSMAVLLVVGGVVLLVVLRRAMTAQFDDALVARAAALQSLTRFDGTKVEMDFAGEAMPRYARRADAEFFVAWVRAGSGWLALERSESLREGPWPPAAMRDDSVGIRDVILPGGSPGRAVVIRFFQTVIPNLIRNDSKSVTSTSPSLSKSKMLLVLPKTVRNAP